MPPDTCPHCGADVPADATACPECGSDESTGWSEQAQADVLGLPQDDFDYKGFVEEEFGAKRRGPRGVYWFWWLIAIAIVVVLLTVWLR